MNSKLSSAISDCLYNLLHYVSMSNELGKRPVTTDLHQPAVSFFFWLSELKYRGDVFLIQQFSNWTLD